MNKQTFLQTQAIELRHLLEMAGDDPIMAPQLRVRLADAEKELAAVSPPQATLLPSEFAPIRAAIFLRGESVQDSEGIRPSLAGEALIQYEKMFIEQALHDEREAAKKAGRQRRPRGASTPGLLFTGTPRGSFGLEFVPQTTEEGYVEAHAQSLRNVATALVKVAESDEKTFDETIKQIPPRVLQPLTQFMKTLSDHHAELRLAFPERPAQSLSVEKVTTAAARLVHDVSQEDETIHGTFRGLTLDTGRFDLRTDAGEFITGTVSDELAEEELAQIARLLNLRCIARIQRTTVRKIGGTESPTYVLLDARSERDSASSSLAAR